MNKKPLSAGAGDYSERVLTPDKKENERIISWLP
jgi:hypothetical protein